MRWLIAFILCLVGAFAINYFLPIWWGFAPVAFVIGVLVKPEKAFNCGVISIFVLWFFWGFYLDTKNESILSSSMAEILPMGGSGIALLCLGAAIAAIIGGFAMMGGKYLVHKKK